MRIIKILIISLFVFIITGCANEKEKCVTIVDEFDNKISNVKVKFSSIKKRNFSSFGNLVTTFSPFHEVDIELTTQKGNLICFENYKYKDKQFIYNDLRTWKFYNDSSKIVYNSFDSIPSKIILIKDVLNAYQLQQLSPNTVIITHSAGNEDIYKANNINSLVNAQTPYYLISAGSPKSKSELKKSASKVGAVIITQINHTNDPVANGWLNSDANYEFNSFFDIKNNHPFTNYYYNEGVKKGIQKAINK